MPPVFGGLHGENERALWQDSKAGKVLFVKIPVFLHSPLAKREEFVYNIKKEAVVLWGF